MINLTQPSTAVLALLAATVGVLIWRVVGSPSSIQDGEPPLVPYRVPWLGHALSFLNDINGFTDWVRSLFPNQPAVTVQIAGRHLYLIFDAKLASQIYRRSRTFIFDPFNLLVWSIVGATKNDLEIAKVGAQTVKKDPSIKDDGRRLLHDLHLLSGTQLVGKPLDELTNRFIETLCEDLDRAFPAGETEWKTVDLCEFVKNTWTHASIVALYGSHIYKVWPGIGAWLWEFDVHLQSIIARMPRLIFPKGYDLRDEGLKMAARWEEEARQAEAEGQFDPEKGWNAFWGHAYNRDRLEILRKGGISSQGRAGNSLSLLWGLNANAIPVATQVINQAVLNTALLADLRHEIAQCQTGPTSFDMSKVTTQPKLKSVYLEALRWATASPSPRVVREDCDLGPYRLKSNSMVIVHSRTLQMDAQTWEISDNAKSDPTRFWPERFLDGDDANEADRVNENAEAEANYLADTKTETQAALPTKHIKKNIVEPISGPKSKDTQQRIQSLRPFGGGTTLCPGRHFATNEILGGLAALMLRLDVEVIEEELQKNGVPQPNTMKQGGLFPDRPLMVRMRRRPQ